MSSYIRKIALIVYLAALAALGPFSMDTYLATLPHIQHLFHSSIGHVQLTVSLFLVGYAIAQLCWGPLSDRWGRKRVLYLGLGIFIIGSLFCVLSTNILELILSRIMQSVGACAGIVMSMAVVRDVFVDRQEMTKVLSTLVSIMMVAPMVAPIIGGHLFVYFNWQANFIFLAAYGVLLYLGLFLLQESHPKERRKKLLLVQLAAAYREQISCLPFLLTTIAVSTNFAVMFAFIASSSFIYITIYHVSPEIFGYCFAVNAVALILGTMSLRPLKKMIGERKVIQFALGISLLGSVLMIASIHMFPYSMLSVMIPSFIVTYAVGIMYPALTGLALSHVVEFSGLSSALLGTMRCVVAAGASAVMGFLIHKSALPLGLTMLVLSTLTMICVSVYLSGGYLNDH